MKKFTFLLVSALLALGTDLWAIDTYEQLQSIEDIDESAQYVLGIDGTGFHYSGTSTWGRIDLPSRQTPIYYTLTKVEADGENGLASFTAKATIDGEEYYMAIPQSNSKFTMVATSTEEPENIYLVIGTTQIEEENLAVANRDAQTYHLRYNPNNGNGGLRSYAGTTGTMAHFYKVIPSSVTVSSIAFSDALPTKTAYIEGQVFDPAGLEVTAFYSDASTKDVTSEVAWTFSADTVKANSTITVTASYYGKTARTTVDVTLLSLHALSISGTPTTTSYYVGDTFDPTGLKVKGTYSDGTTTADLTSEAEWKIVPEILSLETTEVNVVASVEGVSSEAYVVNITVTEPEPYVRVTDVQQLADGQSIIITNADATYALSTEQKSNNRGAAEISLSADGTLIPTSQVQIITLTAVEPEDGETAPKWALQVPTGYLYAAGSGNNYLRTQKTNNANGEWTIAITDGCADIVATGENTNNILRYNSSSKLFSCYEPEKQTAIAIYAVQSSISTAVEETHIIENTVKIVENGQLIIIREGVKYTAQGVRLN